MGRIDYYDDPNAPVANSLVPGGSAIVVDDEGRILLQRRADNDLWALPGGTMDIGETLSEAIVREAWEETGLKVGPTRIVGIYSDPRHVFAYDDGEVRQQFNICLACRILGGEVAAGEESSQVGFFTRPSLTGSTCIPRSGSASGTTWRTRPRSSSSRTRVALRAQNRGGCHTADHSPWSSLGVQLGASPRPQCLLPADLCGAGAPGRGAGAEGEG